MQKDNSTIQRKAALRLSLLQKLQSEPLVMETHAGAGKLFDLVYAEASKGIAFETESRKATLLATQRPTWRVYEASSELGLRAGAGGDWQVNFLDVDPYGACWGTIEAFFESERVFADRMVVAVNDGLRQKLCTGSGWSVGSMKHAAKEFSTAGLYPRYLEICRWNLERIVAPHGYRVTEWAAYYCGFNHLMTHFGAVLTMQ
jgi:hypothetical protein